MHVWLDVTIVTLFSSYVPLLLLKNASVKSGRTVKKADQYKNRHYGRFFYGVKKAPLRGAFFTLHFGGEIANFE